MVNGRPRKTQEELDAEMEDYWGSAAATEATTTAPATSAPSAPAALDDDIEMIE
jgi:THO complex subunit 4